MMTEGGGAKTLRHVDMQKHIKRQSRQSKRFFASTLMQELHNFAKETADIKQPKLLDEVRIPHSHYTHTTLHHTTPRHATPHHTTPHSRADAVAYANRAQRKGEGIGRGIWIGIWRSWRKPSWLTTI